MSELTPLEHGSALALKPLRPQHDDWQQSLAGVVTTTSGHGDGHAVLLLFIGNEPLFIPLRPHCDVAQQLPTAASAGHASDDGIEPLRMPLNEQEDWTQQLPPAGGGQSELMPLIEQQEEVEAHGVSTAGGHDSGQHVGWPEPDIEHVGYMM